MICQNCGQNKATTKFQQNFDGTLYKAFLCNSCAEKLEIELEASAKSKINCNKIDKKNSQLDMQKVCPQCKTSWKEVVSTSFLGCPHCYDFFYAELQSMIVGMQGKVEYVGKGVRPKAQMPLDALQDLKNQLQLAVKEERFFDANNLNEQIKSLSREEK